MALARAPPGFGSRACRKNVYSCVKYMLQVAGSPAVYFSLKTGGFAASVAMLAAKAWVQAFNASLSGAACETAGDRAAMNGAGGRGGGERGGARVHRVGCGRRVREGGRQSGNECGGRE